MCTLQLCLIWEITSAFILSTVAPRVRLTLGAMLEANNIKEGTDVYFRCDIQSNPPPARISWLHDVSSISRGLWCIIVMHPCDASLRYVLLTHPCDASVWRIPLMHPSRATLWLIPSEILFPDFFCFGDSLEFKLWRLENII